MKKMFLNLMINVFKEALLNVINASIHILPFTHYFLPSNVASLRASTSQTLMSLNQRTIEFYRWAHSSLTTPQK